VKKKLKKLKASGSHYDDPSIGYMLNMKSFSRSGMDAQGSNAGKNIFVWLDSFRGNMAREIRTIRCGIPDKRA
jgi:hypothetical protein